MVILTKETEHRHKSSGNIVVAFVLFAGLHTRSFSLDANKVFLFPPCGFMFVKYLLGTVLLYSLGFM